MSAAKKNSAALIFPDHSYRVLVHAIEVIRFAPEVVLRNVNSGYSLKYLHPTLASTAGSENEDALR